MTAFTVRYLPATNTKCARLKVSVLDQKPTTYSTGGFDTNSMEGIEVQAVKQYITEKELTGFRGRAYSGRTTNGDTVVIFGGIQ